MFHETLGSSPQDPARRNAFTRVELLAALLILGLIVACALPALAGSAARCQVAQCLNNLRQVGRAAQMWAGDHDDRLSWRTPTTQGGTFTGPSFKPANAWVEFAFLSNELVTPRILACPADEGVRVAADFGQYRAGQWRANATSYFLNLHTALEYPNAPLFWDRNVQTSGGDSCSFGPVNDARVIFASFTGWTNGVHVLQGNVVEVTGSARTTSSESFRVAITYSEAANVNIHTMQAR